MTGRFGCEEVGPMTRGNARIMRVSTSPELVLKTVEPSRVPGFESPSLRRIFQLSEARSLQFSSPRRLCGRVGVGGQSRIDHHYT